MVKQGYLYIVCTVFMLSLMVGLLGSDASAATYDSLVSQSGLTVASPPVILQSGTTGNSTIYANKTSAGVSISAPIGILHAYAFEASNTEVTTTSGTPINDTPAVLNIVLSWSSTIFIIYNAGNKAGSTENYNGKGCAINVDGVDVAYSWQSPDTTNAADSVTVVYATSLSAGSHVIQGMFFANSAGSTVTIDTRQIAAFWFPQIVASYVRSTTVSQTTSSTPVDDPQAIASFTLNQSSVVFVVYNEGNKPGSAEWLDGNSATINVDGTDVATSQMESPFGADYANSVTVAYVGSLGIGSHTIKGRFFSNTASETSTIDERQLIVFCFPASSITDWFVQSSTATSTSSGTAVNDTQAILNLTLGNNSDTLAMYVGGNAEGATEAFSGKGVGLSVDGTDMSNSTSWQSPSSYVANYPDSVTSLWCGTLIQGSHTVAGRFWANTAGNTVTVSGRQLLILTFLSANVLGIVNQRTNAWNINLQVYGNSNIGRLSNVTISLHDGFITDQVIVTGGSITQKYGAFCNLASGAGSTVYISIENFQTSSQGTSYLYVYLEVLTPNTSTYLLYAITFAFT